MEESTNLMKLRCAMNDILIVLSESQSTKTENLLNIPRVAKLFKVNF